MYAHDLHDAHFWRNVAIGGAILLLLAASAASETGTTVYYQVDYANGTGRDLSTPPKTNQGILRVLRITRVEQGLRGYEILSTGPQALTLVNRGQTYRTDLRWDGKAWVAPAEAAPTVSVSAPSVSGAGGPARAESLRLRASLLELAASLLESREKLAAAGRDLPAPQAAAVAKAREELAAGARKVLAEAYKLGGPAPAGAAPGKATGQVTTRTAPAPQHAAGIAKPLDRVASLPHRVQVWKLPPAEGERTYRVSVGHPEAGGAGAFYYVAYADTTGDGRPDRLLARSDLAAASQAGQWTQWAFSTAYPRVFVGKAWDRADTVHYHTEAVRLDANWRGLSSQSYVAIDAWGLPTRRWGPAWGNLRVWIAQR